jgi:AcrR family transcriptional regulator
MPAPPIATPKAADRILATASELFYREGSRGVGVDEIVVRAGTTKPSLYRAFGSKDQLIAAWLETEANRLWLRFEAALASHPDDPRAQILAWFDALADVMQRRDHRGCGLSNTAVEYPDPRHPGRLVAVAHKEQMRKRLRELTRAMDARKPKKLADSLMLLMEGAYVTSQLFDGAGPAGAARGAAEALIAAHTRGEAGADDD